MRFSGRIPALLALALGLSAWCAAAPAARAQQARDTLIQDNLGSGDDIGAPKRKHRGWVLRHAKKDSAEAQAAYADKLLAKGKLRKAGKAYNALVSNWHDSPEAARAQRALAEIMVKRGKPQRAFEEYQYLIRYFAGTFPYQETLATQFTLANEVRTQRHARLIVFPGYEDPERAVPLYEQIVENGPNWDRAPEAQFNVGAIQETTGDHELAVVAYETLLMRYPQSALAEEAAFRRTCALYELSRKSPRDEDQLREALSATLGFARNFPDHPNAADAQEMAGELKSRLADMYYERALYYDTIAKKPKSAIIAYSDFIAKFPTSDLRATADERVATLQLQLERQHEN